MTKHLKYNVVIIGVSCFDGMASSMRVRNLLETVTFKDYASINNLIYTVDARDLNEKSGVLRGIKYLVVNASSILSVFSSTWQGIRFLKQVKSTSSKNILYHYQYLDIKNVFILLYARIIGYKIILDIVEDNKFYTKFASIKNRLKIITSLRLLKLTPKIAHHVITISHHLQKLMSDVCHQKIPVSLIPITVDLNRFQNVKFEIPSRFKIFYGGSFGEKDGLFYLIRAFGKISEEFDNIELIMTGRASEKDFEKLQSYLGQSKVKDTITHKGFLADDDYYQTLNDCHIFCMTRVNSEFANAGFPFKLGEFLSTGKAVIATNVGDIPRYLEHNENALIIKPDSERELVDALRYLLKNPEMISEIGNRGRQVAEMHFDTQMWSKELLKIFDGL